MLKTYKTLAHSAVIQVSTKNGYCSVFLENGFVDSKGLRGGVFKTDDVELQQGIEKHPRFMSGFYDQIWTDDKETAPVKVKKVKEEEVKE